MTTESWRKHFEFSPCDKDRTNAFCALCKKNYKDQRGIYSNFLKHLKRAHQHEYNQIFNDGNECSNEKENFTNDDQTEFNLATTENKQNRLDSSITKNLIISCNLPFNLVRSTGFRNFMKDCNVKHEPISSKKIKRDVIPSFKNSVHKVIDEKLKNISYMTLTVDAW
ncbi:unnamed protein product [Adineta ricciae]|uniref:BED-type domain-containing protein n=1 Tax=Adineta ricciae TaxID=249248 RepID=A0A815MK53_ADIRI|nr:unnamed protein product [Adineta ricciae]CAF1673875.1 unnamed protein product [Adineta ricciae]